MKEKTHPRVSVYISKRKNKKNEDIKTYFWFNGLSESIVFVIRGKINIVVERDGRD